LLVAMLLVTIACAACSAAAAPAWDPQALARGADVKNLAAGKVESLPTGPVFIRVLRFPQAAGHSIHSGQHVPGFIYVESGVHRLTLAGQLPIDIMAGQAKFHQSVTHTHFNPGPGPSVWYFIALWPSAAKSQPPVDPIVQKAFESRDIAPGVLSGGSYSLVLRRVDLGPNGTTEAHEFGGVSAFFVLSGSVTIKADHQSPTTIAAGVGTAFAPGVGLQELNEQSTGATLLEFLITPEGSEFEIPLRRPPG
jgi:quercetin dioxygenase-like cupin family protein